jgi:acyl-CoA synthetase (NDP forming)
MNEHSHFTRFLSPRSVAIIGASPQRGSPRNTLVTNLLKHGFEGKVYPVSASNAEIEGLKAFKTLAELPEAPDVALIITPAQTVPGLIEECGARGTRNAIVFSSGFEETDSGKEHAVRLREAAAKHGVTVIGPNCQGIWSVRHRAMLTFSPSLQRIEKLQHAPIAVISQSGALAGAICNSLQTNGIGLSYMVSVGNETCFDALDALEEVIEQDDVRVVSLYIEGLEDAGRILPIAQRARERGVQIVVLKAGRSALGQQATASHTGKIASSHAVYADVLEQAGIIAVDSLTELMAAVEILSALGHPRSSGDAKGGVSVLSSSGGAGALLADYSSELGIPMAEFSARTVERLHEALPEFASKANPVDLTGQVNTDKNIFKNTCAAIGDDPRTEAAIIQFSSSGRRYLQENGEVYKALAKQVPVVISFIGETLEKEMRQEFREAGVLLATDPLLAMKALSLLYRRQRALALPKVRERKAGTADATPDDWASLMKFCEDSGVTPAKWMVLKPQERAAVACASMKYPLVVKVLPSESEHKTEMGLVKLRVKTPDEVDAHAADFRAKLGKPDMGVLVQEMAEDGVEVVLSCLRGTDFGPVVSIGTGGVAIELYRDIAHLALPVSKEQVVAALGKLKLATLLQGFRGKPPADIDALAAAAVAFGDMFLAHPKLQEFEVNPVIVKARGQGLCAVDALATASGDKA